MHAAFAGGTIEPPHLAREAGLADGSTKLAAIAERLPWPFGRLRLALAQRLRESVAVGTGPPWCAFVHGASAPEDTPQLRVTIAQAFAFIWAVTASVALVVRTTSDTEHLTAVLALVGLVYALSLGVLLAAKRLSRRAYNVPVGALTLIVASGQYLAGTAPAGHLFLLFYATGVVFVAYFFSAVETAFQILLVVCSYEALGLAGRPHGISPWYAPATAIPLAILAVLVITIRGRSKLAEDHLLVTSAEVERGSAILAAVAFAAERFLQAPRWETAIEDVLARLGEAASVSRVHIFENSTADGQLFMNPRHEWNDGHTPPLSGKEGFGEMLLFPQWAEVLSRGDVVRQLVRDLPAEHRAMLVSKDLRSTLIVPIAAAQSWWGEITFDDTTSERAWSAAEVEALRAAAGTLGAAIERRRAEEALRAKEERERLLTEQRAQVERLRELDRLKDELVSTVSHELRTPLTSILGLTEYLTTRDLDDATRSRYHSLIRAQAERLDVLIDDFLDLQRIEQGQFQAAPEPIEVGPLLIEQTELYAGQSADHRLELELPEEPLVVLAERDRVEQVVGNLLSNAIKYSPRGGGVALTARPDGRFVRVSVEDHGLGIPDEFREQIFSRFFRVDSSDTRRIGGTGLGLAVSRKIVEAYGGRMGFDSVAGAGSTFWFELPRAPQGNRS